LSSAEIERLEQRARSITPPEGRIAAGVGPIHDRCGSEPPEFVSAPALRRAR